MRAPAAVLAFLFLVASASAAAPARYDARLVVRAHARTHADLDLILRTSPDVWSHRLALGPIDCMVDAEGLATLRAAGLDARVLIPDVQRAIEQERAPVDQAAAAARGGDWFFDYHPYAEFSTYADALVALRPDLCSRLHVGTSLQGREIFALRITGPGPSASRPAAFLNGCQHAREWIAAATPMYIADRLVRAYSVDESVARLVDNVEFLIVPIVNPDGYEFTWVEDRLWRKNRRANDDGTLGVDLNRNWGHQWGGPGSSGIPSTNIYAGAFPFSEPETLALREFIEARPNIRAAIDFHSYSQLVMSPWAWTTSTAPDGAFMNQLAADIAAAFNAEWGMTYQSGPVAQILYLASGSSSDWIYAARNAYAFGVELRDTGEFGFVLPAAQIRPTGEEAFEGVRVLAERLIEPPGPFMLIEPAAGAIAVPTSPSLRWNGSQNAARFEVIVSENEDLTSPVFTQTVRNDLGATVPATALVEGGRYWWTVRAVGAASSREASGGPRSFRVKLRADLNLDGLVSVTDLGILVGSWGPCAGPCASDLNRDGRTDAQDLAILLGYWG